VIHRHAEVDQIGTDIVLTVAVLAGIVHVAEVVIGIVHTVEAVIGGNLIHTQEADHMIVGEKKVVITHTIGQGRDHTRRMTTEEALKTVHLIEMPLRQTIVLMTMTISRTNK